MFAQVLNFVADGRKAAQGIGMNMNVNRKFSSPEVKESWRRTGGV